MLHGFQKLSRNGWDYSRARELNVGGLASGIATVREMEIRAKANRGRFTADVYLGGFEPGDDRTAQLKVEGRQLRGTERRFEVSL